MFDYDMCMKCRAQWPWAEGRHCEKCEPHEPEVPKPTFDCKECGGNDENPKGHCSDCIVVVDMLRELLHVVHGMKSRRTRAKSVETALKLADEIENLIVPGKKT